MTKKISLAPKKRLNEVKRFQLHFLGQNCKEMRGLELSFNLGAVLCINEQGIESQLEFCDCNYFCIVEPPTFGKNIQLKCLNFFLLIQLLVIFS